MHVTCKNKEITNPWFKFMAICCLYSAALITLIVAMLIICLIPILIPIDILIRIITRGKKKLFGIKEKKMRKWFIKPSLGYSSDKNVEEQLEKMLTVLDKHNMKISIKACGCCGSPEIKFEYNGKTITDTENFNCDMFINMKNKENEDA